MDYLSIVLDSKTSQIKTEFHIPDSKNGCKNVKITVLASWGVKNRKRFQYQLWFEELVSPLTQYSKRKC